MKKNYVDSLVTGSDFDDFFLMKSMAVRVGSNQKKYMDIILGDRTGDISAKKWDASDEEIAELESYGENAIIKVRAAVTEWQGKQQLKVTRFRQASEADDFDIREFIRTAPEKGSDMYDYIMKEIAQIGDPQLKSVCSVLMERNKEKLMYYPAASKNHHAVMSGLLFHMKRMLAMGKKACEVYENLDPDWVVTGVVIHDMEKIDEILSNRWGISPGYSFEGQMLGHITQGVKMIDRLARELELDDEKAVMLEHMILTHHYEPEFGSPKRPMFPEAELLHYLDIFDARLFDMEEATASVPPGEFSEKVWTLENRRVYKPTFRR